MSVPLTVLRLEIADDSKIPDFSYQVKRDPEQVEKPTKESCESAQLTRDSVLLRGKRKYCNITIETYMATAWKAKSGSLFDTDDSPAPDRASQTQDTSDSVTASKKSRTFAEVIQGANDGETKEKPPTFDREKQKAESLEVMDQQPEKVEKEATISGALKNQLHKSHSVDSPRGSKHSPPSAHSSREMFTPVNLDLEEARSRAAGKAHSPLPDSLTFFCGNPSVETTEGIIHLYKENEPTSLGDGGIRGELLCMLNVPTTLTSQDLIQMIGPVERYIEHIKIIRDGTPNSYMVLVKFSSQKHTDEFYDHFNGKPFNSIEPEVCYLVYVAQIEAIKSANGAGFPIPGVTELPTCPVCLERMDESVNGILTILCNHSFHTACLAHWDDTSCPVCRYTQTPESVADNKCFECSAEESLWICLICGYVGCGRYVQGHAFRHFQETNHTYSMQLGHNRVWDYAGDNYVHRLVQNKSDGKMVQVGEDGLPQEGDEKLDAITLEYTYLLNTQLESQRHYFEAKLSLVEQEALKQLEESETRSRQLADECAQAQMQLTNTHKDKTSLDKKYSEVASRYSKTLRQLNDEQEMNKFLRENQAGWQNKVEELETRMVEKDQELSDLRDQLRDLMLHLGAQEKLQSAGDVSQQEIQDSHLVVGAVAASKKSRKKHPR